MTVMHMAGGPAWPVRVDTLYRICRLLRVGHSPGFPDHCDLDLAGILHLVFNFLRDIEGKLTCSRVGDHIGIDHDAKLTTGLDGETLTNPFETKRQFFQILD